MSEWLICYRSVCVCVCVFVCKSEEERESYLGVKMFPSNLRAVYVAVKGMVLPPAGVWLKLGFWRRLTTGSRYVSLDIN